MKRLPVALLAVVLVVLALVPLSGLLDTTATPSGSPEPALSDAPGSASPAATDGAAQPSPTDGATPPAPTTTPVALADVPVVPVTHFRTTRDGTHRAEVRDVLAGNSERYAALELVAGEADGILAALGIEQVAGELGDRLVLADDAAALTADLADHRDRLAFLRATDVTPAVRALAWGDAALFGNDRVRDLGDWPLVASLPATDAGGDGDGPVFDPSTTWTLFAGGDILLDRGVHETIAVKGKGEDFPFDGGTAEITSRYCCSSFGWDLPRTRRTGDAGAVREVISGADIAIANFENPAPDRPRWHTSGTVFNADPDFIEGLVDAGIDYVGLANNHIGDAGRNGILQTIDNLEDHGLAYSGAGKDEAAARTPALLEAAGTTVAILAYDRIARVYFADADTPGSAPLSIGRVRDDIAAAREAGADVVVVFPHWGTEYQATPFAKQQDTAHQIIEAGADLIIGNHAHWAAAMEIHEGAPIWYGLGNFVFDQTWSEPTMEGITLELTFRGAELVQIRMRPHIILDKAQPNFLDPAGDGRVVLGQVYDASAGLLPY